METNDGPTQFAEKLADYPSFAEEVEEVIGYSDPGTITDWYEALLIEDEGKVLCRLHSLFAEMPSLQLPPGVDVWADMLPDTNAIFCQFRIRFAEPAGYALEYCITTPSLNQTTMVDFARLLHEYRGEARRLADRASNLCGVLGWKIRPTEV